ncbi:MAG: uroporphyrinogen-III synthase [Cognatishimia sp.]|uniref:uroporphyrinogen-III synthase n=1 Tax=Cognatishimia sp. TaxID=2211648 RepID=UPI003B8BB3BD
MGLPLPKPIPSLLLTRPQAQSEQFANDLREAGFEGEIVISPLMEIQGVGSEVDPDSYDVAIFTSRNAVDFVQPAQKLAWCVGNKTAEKARASGWMTRSSGGDVEDLLAAIQAAVPAGRAMHFRGEHSRGAVIERLKAAGFIAQERIVYRQVSRCLSPSALALLSGETPVIVPLFSPRSASFFAEEVPKGALIWGVAMSEAVAKEMESISCDRLHIAQAPTAADMMRGILSLIDAA